METEIMVSRRTLGGPTLLIEAHWGTLWYDRLTLARPFELIDLRLVTDYRRLSAWDGAT